jgi:alpha-L-fucosidase
LNRRSLLLGGACAVALTGVSKVFGDSRFFRGQIPEGPFSPFWESLKSYRCPDWFRDAKFGIWAHWSPQCVPEQGDWYARNMYIQGSAQYEYHPKQFGHPSQFGYKDVCHLWKAERWDPEALVKLYKRAGAEYLVSLATHHDNFDCWNSKYQPWNCVNVGPKRDIVGTWAKVARDNGLRFGVSYHGTPHRTWDEFLPVRYKSDKTGPLTGVPYDGMQTTADGKGKWWDGMDPQMLNGRPHAKNTPCPEFVQQFLLRVQDVIDSYSPDILNFDDGAQFTFDAGGAFAPDLQVWLGIPDLAPQIMAYYYNKNVQANHGRLEGVVDLKEVPEPVWGALTRDFEMSMADRLQEEPWQTEACIGQWHYNRALFANHTYQKASLIIPLLVDIVSKNGNLLLSIPLPGHGEPDSDELSFLGELAEWQQINSEAIKGTRPWKIYGEGSSTQPNKISSYELSKYKFDHSDLRFTTKGEALYAIGLGWPTDGKILIKSLAEGSANYPRQIRKVELLGATGELKWSRGTHGLEIQVPDVAPCKYAFSFRILAG